jgi:hypothetical protein
MTKEKSGTAAYVTGFLDGKSHKTCGISLSQDLLTAADDYARGLRAGYQAATAARGEVQPSTIGTVLAFSSRQVRREFDECSWGTS